MTWKFRDGSQYQASLVAIAKYLNRAGWCQIGENTEKLQLNTINLAKLPGQGGRTTRMGTEGSKTPYSRQTQTSLPKKTKHRKVFIDVGCN